MKPVFDKVEFLDNKAYEKYKLQSTILMEHAALGLLQEIEKKFEKASVLVVCGSGNNGGDGLALARLLLTKGYQVKIYMPNPPSSKDSMYQMEVVKTLEIEFVDDIESLKVDVVVDALFGSGLNRSLEEWSKTIIKKMNTIEAYKVACDIPSGITINGEHNVCFKADVTVTMGAGKKSLYVDGTKNYVGKIVTKDLGLPYDKYVEESNINLLELSDMKLPHRMERDSHKGTYGHLAVIMGEKHGAALIAGKSAIRFGAGLVTVVVKDGYQVTPELMQSKKIPENANVVALGMGLGNRYISEEINDMLENRTAVIDADLLNNKLIVNILESKKDIVITPHPKEFAGLLTILGANNMDTATVQKNRFELAEEFSLKYPNVVLLLKGANSIIAKNGKMYINNEGTPALAKGGSGDVLAGLIGALVAQGYSTLDATISASLAHAIAASNYKGNDFALTPMDLITEVTKLNF